MHTPNTDTALTALLHGLERSPGQLGHHFAILNRESGATPLRLSSIESIGKCAKDLDPDSRDRIASALFQLATKEEGIRRVAYQEIINFAPTSGATFHNLVQILPEMADEELSRALTVLTWRAGMVLEGLTAISVFTSLARIANERDDDLRGWALGWIGRELGSEVCVNLARIALVEYPRYLDPKGEDSPMTEEWAQLIRGVVLDGAPHRELLEEMRNKILRLARISPESLLGSRGLDSDKPCFDENALGLLAARVATSPATPYDGIAASLAGGSRLVFCTLFQDDLRNAVSFAGDLIRLMASDPDLSVVTVCAEKDVTFFSTLAAAESDAREGITRGDAGPPFMSIGNVSLSENPNLRIGQLYRDLIATGRHVFVVEPEALHGELKVRAVVHELEKLVQPSGIGKVIVLCSNEYASKADESEPFVGLSLVARCPIWAKPKAHLVMDWDRLESARGYGIHNLAALHGRGIAGEFTVSLGDSAEDEELMKSAANQRLGIGVQWDSILVYGKRDEGDGEITIATDPRSGEGRVVDYDRAAHDVASRS